MPPKFCETKFDPEQPLFFIVLRGTYLLDSALIACFLDRSKNINIVRAVILTIHVSSVEN